jgi:colicin import membrane protein
VEAIIKSQWEPPPIDVGGQTYNVVVRFRYYRNGTVKDVTVQQTSGNSYFDDAGKRAILKPRQFPMFPSDMTEAYQDVEMVFRVGESAG